MSLIKSKLNESDEYPQKQRSKTNAIEGNLIFSGHVGVVYCLDSSPAALRAQLDAILGSPTDAQLQNAIIKHMYKLMSGRHSTDLEQELETKDNWTDKVELCINKLRGLAKYSNQYKRCLLNSAYNRIVLAREYEPDFELESELVLIKGIPHKDMAELADDFGLSKYTKKPVKVFDIESDHASAPQDCRLPNIVNKFLEPQLIEEFKTRNLCWTYFADATKTW